MIYIMDEQQASLPDNANLLNNKPMCVCLSLFLCWRLLIYGIDEFLYNDVIFGMSPYLH